MNNPKRSEIPLKFIERIYDQHANMQSTIDSMLVDVSEEEDVSAEKVFFSFFFLS